MRIAEHPPARAHTHRRNPDSLRKWFPLQQPPSQWHLQNVCFNPLVDRGKLLLAVELIFHLFPSYPYGGSLSYYLSSWELITLDRWILEAVFTGFSIQSSSLPPHSSLGTLLTKRKKFLLAPGEIEPVPSERGSSYQDRILFLVFSCPEEQWGVGGGDQFWTSGLKLLLSAPDSSEYDPRNNSSLSLGGFIPSTFRILVSMSPFIPHTSNSYALWYARTTLPYKGSALQNVSRIYSTSSLLSRN